jgi:signal transduction histidine kinase
MLGATLSNLRVFSLIPSNDLTVNSVQIFSAIEILLWSIALINTFFEERKLKDEAVKIALSAKELLIENQKNTQDYLEREVRKRTQELQDAIAKEKSIRVKHMRFGAMISHEFRNPLAIIDAQTTMILKEQLPEKQSLSRRVSTITAASNRLHRLFDKWIKNDQINMLHEEIDLAKLDIYDLIESIFNKCKGLYPEHEFVLNCDKKNKHMISANQDWLEMAITNLVDNACKYSKQQSQIRIECIQENSNTVISVIDHGIGIAPEFHGKIFNEYYRVNSNGATAGIGLGLSLVKKIVELHHASVDFVSSPGKGTTFRITFKNLSSNSSS